MTIEAGTKIGRYEIQALLGVGGMGEVYRALDTELNRPVALKFLSAEFTADQKRMQRFIQEARAASALNHPNIITVHEIGRPEEEQGARFFVTEFIDGVTLRERMAGAKMRLDEVLELAIQIANALTAAHAAGIVHRDIKPENIMVRRDGYVKVLDFGLAKPTEKADVDTEAATKKLVNTNPGTVMGTVAYMSPEQAIGGEIDARTDIWSLGVVLYEMVAGRQPFEGATVSHVIVSILEKEPPPLALHVQDVPEALELIVTEALTKDREERCQTARELHGKLRRLKQRVDAGSELERSVPPRWSGTVEGLSAYTRASYGGQSTTDAPARTTARSGEVGGRAVSSAEYVVNTIKGHKAAALLAFVLGALALVGLGFGVYKLVGEKGRPAPPPPLKITRLTSDGKSFNPAISPDGKYIAHVFSDAGRQRIMLRQAATTTTRELVPPTDGRFIGLTFSRDGSYLYYVKGEKGANVQALYQVSVLGGESRRVIYDVDSAVTFSPDGKRLAFRRGYLKEDEDAIIVANADGTGEERLTVRKRPQYVDDPAWSPDGQAIAFVLVGTDAEGYYVNVEEIRVADRAERKISADRWRAIDALEWLADGSGLVATARDRASIAGSPLQLWHIPYAGGAARKLTNDVNNYTAVRLAADSRSLVAVLINSASNVWVAQGADVGRARQVTSSNQAGNQGLTWTPDGRLVYMSVERENRDLWVMNADGSGQKQLTFEPAADLSPSVSPDGRYIVYVSNRGAGWGIWRMNSDGGNQIEIVKNIEESSSPRCSPDSRWVIYSNSVGGRKALWKILIEGGDPVQLSEKAVYGPVISPDGKLIAGFYRAPEINSPLQIEVIAFDTGAPLKTLDSPPNAFFLRWSPDGRALNYLEYRDGTFDIWSLPLDGGRATRMTELKSDQILGFEWSPDGKQLALARGTTTSDLVLVEDFVN